jgi:hypothetical protein
MGVLEQHLPNGNAPSLQVGRTDSSDRDRDHLPVSIRIHVLSNYSAAS